MREYLQSYLAFGFFLFTTTVQADDFCKTLNSVANKAYEDFRSLKGERNDRDGYDSKVQFPGASLCYITSAGYFVCRWQSNVSTGAEAEAAQLSDGVAGCYPTAEFKEFNTATRTATMRYSYKINGVALNIGFNEKYNTVRLSISSY